MLLYTTYLTGRGKCFGQWCQHKLTAIFRLLKPNTTVTVGISRRINTSWFLANNLSPIKQITLEYDSTQI